MIGIINYGVGNLQNIQNALNFLGVKSKIITTPKQLNSVTKIILPGVGSFGFCMKKVQEYNFYDCLKEKVLAGLPILGICVGMQILFDKGEEGGNKKGLAILEGNVVHLESTYKVPQIGWNQVLFKLGNQSKQWFYFVHSYHCLPKDSKIIVAYCNYGTPIVSIVKKK